MILGIDFDDVLHDSKHPAPGRRMGPPMDGAVEAMNILKEAGHELVIFTVRADKPDHVADWLRFFGIPFDRITNRKEQFDIILDDHAVRFTSWADFLK